MNGNIELFLDQPVAGVAPACNEQMKFAIFVLEIRFDASYYHA